jgi:hypothetical protein
LTCSRRFAPARTPLSSFVGSSVCRLSSCPAPRGRRFKSGLGESSDCHSSSPFSSLRRLAARLRRQFIGRAPMIPWSDLYVHSSRRKLEILPILRQGRPAQNCQSATGGWAGDLVRAVHILRNPGSARIRCRRGSGRLADSSPDKTMRNDATASHAGRASGQRDAYDISTKEALKKCQKIITK